MSFWTKKVIETTRGTHGLNISFTIDRLMPEQCVENGTFVVVSVPHAFVSTPATSVVPEQPS